ncbi:MAG: carbohydrate binding domain-containing protein [Clostridia bacterium]|nr:carbohydrate binding domain-containing protein [Clostridia bacterium]
MKKIVAILVCVLMMVTVLPVTYYASTPVNLLMNGDFQTGAVAGSTNITGWTNTYSACEAKYGITDGDAYAEMIPTGSRLYQRVSINEWAQDGSNFGYELSLDMEYNKGGYPAFEVEATFENGSVVTQRVSVVRNAADVTDAKSQIHATLWQWNELRYDLSWITQGRTDKLTAIGVALISGGAGCNFDNVVLKSTGENYINNGGFENVNAAKTAANQWGNFGTWSKGSVLSLVKASDNANNVHSGSYAVKMETRAGDNPFIVQTGIPVSERCKYRLSFWYKGTTTSSGMNVKFEMWGNGQSVKDLYSDSVTTSADWKYKEYEFYVADGVDAVTVMPRTYAEGTVIYLDDISLKLIEGPKQFDMQTDWVFYYQNYNQATVTLTMDEFYSDTGYSVDMVILDGDETVVQQRNLHFTNNSLVKKMDISSLDKKVEYILRAIIKDNRGAIVETISEKIYRIDRPTSITEDGVYMVDGKPFNPVLAYHFDLNDYEDAKQAGVNVIQWAPSNGLDRETSLAELDNIHAKGLKAAVVCYWGMKPAGHSDNADRIAQFVEYIKDHPAVFCYMVMDEPFSHASSFGGEEAMKDILRISYKTIRTIDDAHPVFLCEDQKGRYSLSAKYVDCLGIDPYPGTEDFSKHVGDMALAAVEGAKGVKPVYAIVQAFSWKGITPTAEMLRAELYQALMGGAHAVGYYTWVPDDPSLDTDLNEGRYWDTMVSTYQKDMPHLFAHYGRGEYPTITKSYTNLLWYEVWQNGADIYAAILNRSDSAATAQVPLGLQLPTSSVVEIVNGGDISAAELVNLSALNVNLSPYQAILCKISSPELDTENLLVNGGFADGISGWGNESSVVRVVEKSGTGGADNYVHLLPNIDANGNNVAGAGSVDQIYSNVTEGEVYLLEAKYKANASGSAYINVTNSAWTKIVDETLPATGQGALQNTPWSTYRKLIRVSDAMDIIRVSLRAHPWNTGVDGVMFDNVRLVKMDVATEENYIVNPGFEYDRSGETAISGFDTTGEVYVAEPSETAEYTSTDKNGKKVARAYGSDGAPAGISQTVSIDSAEKVYENHTDYSWHLTFDDFQSGYGTTVEITIQGASGQSVSESLVTGYDLTADDSNNVADGMYRYNICLNELADTLGQPVKKITVELTTEGEGAWDNIRLIPVYTPDGNYALNPGFEQLENGNPVSWSFALTTAGEALKTDGGGTEGTNYIVLSQMARADGSIPGTVLHAPGEYNLTFDYKQLGTDGFIKIEDLANGSTVFECSMGEATGTDEENLEWREFTCTFTLTAAHSNGIRLLMRNGADGNLCYYDNIRITR